MVRENLQPLLNLIIEKVKPSSSDKKNLLQCFLLFSMQIVLKKLSWKIAQGTAKANQQIKAINLEGNKVDEGRLTKYLDMRTKKFQ